MSRGELEGSQTWRYTLRDESRQNIARIVKHQAVADTNYIDRSTFTMVQDLRIVPRGMRALKQAAVLRFGGTSFIWAALLFGIIGLGVAWSLRRNPMFLILGIALLLRLVLVSREASSIGRTRGATKMRRPPLNRWRAAG